jgi:hypothetical protein
VSEGALSKCMAKSYASASLRQALEPVVQLYGGRVSSYLADVHGTTTDVS